MLDKTFTTKFKGEAYTIPIALSLFLVPIFFNPLFIYSFTQGKEILFKCIILITLLIVSVVLARKSTLTFKDISKSKIFVLLLIQFLIYLTTNAISKTPLVTIYGTYSRGFGFIVEAFLGIFLTYCALTISEKDIRKLLKLSFLGGLIIAAYAFFQKTGLDPFFSNYSTKIFAGRPFSLLGNPSYLGQFMLPISIIGGHLSISEKVNRTKIIFTIGTILTVSTLILSGTRTALLGLMAAIILLLIKYRSIFKKIVKKLIIPIIIAAFIVIIVVIKFPSDRFSLSSTALRSLYSRIEIWKGATSLIEKKLLTGYGGETFYIYFPEIATKEFFTLEEDINTSADRVHNESLEILFSHGIFALITYLAILITTAILFFKNKNPHVVILSLLVIANAIQNQFSFPDIATCILISFCFGSLIALSADEKISIKIHPLLRYTLSGFIILAVLISGYGFVYKPFMSHLAYTESYANYSKNYETAVNKHKEALVYTPYYSELWYELMFIDKSSMERALSNLEQIEKDSGNVLAWKGNFYADKDPQKAGEYYIMALEKNPYNPNWIRAFADMLYKQKDYETALYMYDKYLESIPDFWKWADDLTILSKKDKDSYETFLKHTPFFWGTIEKIENAISILGGK